MDFRRVPFNFTATDPLKRQQELQRRFGLPANKGNMFVDFANPGAMNTRSENSSASNSPRLQHRVPIFVEGLSEPTEPSVNAQNVDNGRKPHVRVIPIEIEGEDNTYKRHRSFSGSSEPMQERNSSTSVPVQTLKQSVPQSLNGPRVCNIPIKIEGSDHVGQTKSPVKSNKVLHPESLKHSQVKLNGCSASKVAKVNQPKDSVKEDEIKESPEKGILRKIQNVEEKLKDYHADVEKFSGTNKEKQYRYLDEMLTRCMLELDEIDTMGFETIRLARKAAVKKVQASIDLLDLKITKESKESVVLKEPMEGETIVDQAVEDANGEDMQVEDLEETKTPVEFNVKTENSNVEMYEALPEKINKEVEKISIMENGDNALESSGKELTVNVTNSLNEDSVTEKMNTKLVEPVQIAKLEAEADYIALEFEPIVEEPLSDCKNENTNDMDLVSCNCETDLDKPADMISEMGSCSDLDANDLKTIGQLDEDLEMGVPEVLDLKVAAEQTDLSNPNQTAVYSLAPPANS